MAQRSQIPLDRRPDIIDLTTEEVAAKLGKSVGAIYTARSRIMFRLREVISELGEQNL